MLKDYLDNRIQLLKNEIDEYEDKVNHYQSNIKEIDSQISKMKKSVDEASGIFSIKARENIDSNNDQALDLENEKTELLDRISIYNLKIEKIQEEIDLISDGIKELNVSRETSTKNTSVFTADDLPEKIDMCIKICKVDPNRVEIELKEILKILKK